MQGAAALKQVSAETIKARMFETLRTWSLHGSRRRPLIIVIENLHWIDRASEEFLASLVDVRARRVDPPPLHVPARIPAAVERQVLRDPDRAPAARSARQPRPRPLRRAGRDRLRPAGARRSSRAAEGNPFFLEELVARDRRATGGRRAAGRARDGPGRPPGAHQPPDAGRAMGRSRPPRCWAARCRSISCGRSGRGRARSSPTCAS